MPILGSTYFVGLDEDLPYTREEVEQLLRDVARWRARAESLEAVLRDLPDWLEAGAQRLRRRLQELDPSAQMALAEAVLSPYRLRVMRLLSGLELGEPMTLEEVAEELKTSRATIKTQRNGARAQLRKAGINPDQLFPLKA